MTEQLKDVRFYDQTLFRVWPDGTVQEADQAAYSWMSDDHALAWAYDEAEALKRANVRVFAEAAPKLRFNWLGAAAVAYMVLGFIALAWGVVRGINWVLAQL